MATHDGESSSTEQAPTEPLQLSLNELTNEAGVTVRTVRYYISEGLLPPPESAGRQSHYTQGHLDRLRLIGRLKDAYLPLREIRRRLAGLDDAAVRELLAREGEAPPAPTSARAYLDQLLGPRPAPSPGRQQAPSQSRPPDRRPPLREERLNVEARLGALPDEPPASPAPTPSLMLGAAMPLAPAPADSAENEGEPDAWRRVRLGDDAELLIREAAYERRPDRIDWLIRWARRVFR